MDEMRKALEELIQKSVADITAKFEEHSAEVKKEVSALSKQVEDFGGDLDSVKRQHAENLRVPPLPRAPLQADKGVARLTNNGPTLLPGHAQPLATDKEFERRADVAAPDHGDFRAKPPKHNFPAFNGDHPLLWVDLCYVYFDMYSVPAHHWVSTASLYFEGHAALWLQAYKRQHRLVSWDSFIAAIADEFGADEFDDQMSTLLQLKQTGSVIEYKQAFEACMYHLLSVDSTLSPRWFVSQFTFGLSDEVRAAVRLQKPTSVTRAASLARIQEEENMHTRPRGRPPAPTKHPPALPAAPSISTAPRVDAPPRRAGDDFGRERQLRDFRRANGLCYKCGDKYSKDHQCKKPGQSLMIEVGDFGEVLSEDTIHALNLLEEMPDAQCCQLSVHALAGTEDVETLRLRAMVGSQVMLLLVDSGSSHSFVNSAFVARAGCDITPVDPVRVRVANGQFMSSTSAVKNLSWWYNGTTFADDMRILDLGGYDAVLGMDWLKKFSPMVSDWANKRLIVPKDGQWVTLQGMQMGVQSELLEISPEQLGKCISGNDVWALAMLESVLPLDVASTPMHRQHSSV
jgi:hypothetical protein